MAAGLVITVVETLFKVLHSKELRELRAMSGYKSRLEELQDSVTTIRAVLLDAEAKQDQLSHEAKVWFDRLKNAVYDADDLFDKFITISQQEKQLHGGKILKKVRRFFSNSNPLIVAMSMSQEIKGIKKKLDAIASDHTMFGLSTISQPRERSEETMSYVHEQDIIGRESDKEAIVGMLVSDAADVSFVTIVGMGGLGKTALAQLVYNDDRVKSAFQFKMWVCVSEEFGLKEILGKMFSFLPNTMQGRDGIGMDKLQTHVREHIQGKRFLLVLDDVWNDNCHDWVKLKEFLILGAMGSRILVTTRSKSVGAMVGEYPMYELQGLTKENSWLLFKNMAYKKGQEEAEPDLVEIGKDIVEKCANVPLALRVVGSMLYGQEKSKWILIKRNDLAKVEQGTKDCPGIMSTLKLSYHNLPSPLRSCFSFCALFPKDDVMEKERLINLWLAHNCLVPTLEGQSIEDVGEEYFLILLQRCILQDIEVDKEYGDIISCKMHDLIRDLAQEVAGNEYLIMPSNANSFGGNIRHLSMSSPTATDYVVNTKMLRTFLWLSHGSTYPLNQAMDFLAYCKRMRVLDMNCSLMKTLPLSVCELLHLRYINLSSCCYMLRLPNSVTKLRNLQVLILRDCSSLRELPRDLSKLVSLRHLDIKDCMSLTHMPPHMDRLTCLHTLNRFVIGEANGKGAQIGQLEDLKALTKLRGDLVIDVRLWSARNASDMRQGTNVLSKAKIKTLTMKFGSSRVEGDVHEALLEVLQPNNSLKEIVMWDYEGVKLPSWRWPQICRSNSLPCLLRIKLWHLTRLQNLPALSHLPHLKYLELYEIPNVEYMEEKNGDATGSSTEQVTFFPSLEELWLRKLSKLKGWWRELSCVGGTKDEDESGVLPFFPRLRELSIDDCESITSFPAFPHVKNLELYAVKEIVFRLGWSCLELESLERRVIIDNVEYLSWLPEEFARGLVHLEIRWCKQESLWRVGQHEGLRRCASSLRCLKIWTSSTLKTLQSGGLEHLTNLQVLIIGDADNLIFEEEGDDGVTPWKSLKSLRSMELRSLPKLVNLPHGFQYLTALHSLNIHECENFIGLPEWLCCLSSLHSLIIKFCPRLNSLPEAMRHLTSLKLLSIKSCGDGLMERCQAPSGEDWPKISHIPELRTR